MFREYIVFFTFDDLKSYSFFILSVSSSLNINFIFDKLLLLSTHIYVLENSNEGGDDKKPSEDATPAVEGIIKPGIFNDFAIVYRTGATICK